MTGTEKANKQSHLNDESVAYEDEINLVDYILVIWKYKWFILIASLLSAMLVGAYLYFSPRTYEVTYVYDLSKDIIIDALEGRVGTIDETKIIDETKQKEDGE